MSRVAGLRIGIPEDEYHSWPGASASRLKDVQRSPAHCYHSMLHRWEPTDSMRMGSAVHAAILDPLFFQSAWCRMPGNMRRDLRDEEYRRLTEEYGASRLLKEGEYSEALAISGAVRKHPTAAKILGSITEHELSANWYDEGNPVPRKMRADGLCRELGIVFDLKTCADASKAKFSRAIFDYGYHIQAAHYLAGLRALDVDVQNYAIVAVENDAPFLVAVYELDTGTLLSAETHRKRLLRIFDECYQKNEWPGYPEEPQSISIPPWAANQINEFAGY